MSKLDQQAAVSKDTPALQSTPQPPAVQAFPQPATLLDDFNRADGPLGANWVVQQGSANVLNNAARADGTGAATYIGGQGAALEADVEAISTSSDYLALVLDYADNANNLYLKVQQQDGGGAFDSAACYYGNNGASFGLGFFSLDTPFTTAHMRVERINSTVTMTFTNIDGGSESQQYTCANAPASGGTGIGIGGWTGISALDNFASGGEGQMMMPVPTSTPIGYLLIILLLVTSGFGYLRLRAK